MNRLKEQLYRSMLVFFLISQFAVGGVRAYEEIPVNNGASVKGTVKLSGPVPSPLRFRLTMGAYPEHCRPLADTDGNVLLPRARVSKDQNVQDAVVFIQGLERGKPQGKEGPKLTVNRCQFDQLVLAGMDGTALSLVMNDTVLHPLRGWEMLNEGRIPLFHFPTMETGEEQSAKLTTRRSGMVKVECDQHRFMQAWILVPINPYFSKTDEDGQFQIDDIPPGTYTVSVWHPSLGYLEQPLTVGANEQQSLTFQFHTTHPEKNQVQ
ncbi:MAG: carboxypeptidase-like regulatory domain-containing protein [Nitrospirales bacterium]|nr:hypothetical protein [Nitrospira sp.]MDR4502884.1 carboxypeptidase-like regulatory domain-containing protein [Nitrospirales bacterium]